MDEIEVQACYMMCMCWFFILNMMMTVCAIKQRNDRNGIVQYEIQSTSVERRKQYEHLHREPIDSPLSSDNRASETSRRRKRKALARDPTIETISENFRHFVEMVLVKDEEQLKIFFDLPDNKKLCFCRVLLARMSYCPPSI
ncbi:hypothetical protein DsansV1_C06g0062871 [Dioscorea sansibarensis]